MTTWATAISTVYVLLLVALQRIAAQNPLTNQSRYSSVTRINSTTVLEFETL